VALHVLLFLPPLVFHLLFSCCVMCVFHIKHYYELSSLAINLKEKISRFICLMFLLLCPVNFLILIYIYLFVLINLRNDPQYHIHLSIKYKPSKFINYGKILDDLMLCAYGDCCCLKYTLMACKVIFIVSLWCTTQGIIEL